MRCERTGAYKKTLGFIACMMAVPYCAANQPMTMSLKEAVLLSLRYSPVVKAAELQRVVDKFALSVAKNQFEFTYALTGGVNQTNAVSNGDPLNIAGNYNLNTTINRNSIYGTKYSLGMNNPVAYTKAPGIPTAFYNPALTFTAVQPILKGSGREVVESQLVQAVNTEQSTEFAYKSSIMAKVTQIVQEYRAVVSAENQLVVARDALKTSIEVVKQNKARIRLGFMAPSENVQAEAQVAQQQLQVTSAEFSVMSSKLTLLKDIGLSPTTPLRVDKSISIKEASYPKGEEAKRLLFTNNPAYLQAVNGLKNAKLALLQAEDQQRWQLDLTSTIVQGQGSGGNGNDGIASLYNGRNRSRAIGLQLNVPIDNLPLQAQLVGAKVAYTQAQLGLQDLRLNLETTLMTSLENLRILFMQVKLAVDAQNLAYQTYQNALIQVRFGKSSMFEVTTLQSNYITASITTITTEISYLNAVADYYQLLGITLNIWDINLVY